MTLAEQLAILRAFVASRPEVYLIDDEPYDGPLPEVEWLSGREADRRAGWHYPEGP